MKNVKNVKNVKNILASILLIALTACATQPKPLPKPLPLVAQKQQVNVPPDLLKNCKDLTKLDPTKAYDQGATVGVTKIWSAEHTDCEQRFLAVRNLVAQAFNLNIDAQGNLISAAIPASNPASNTQVTK
jgi:hypothetical protein